jgi:hypothetical protein
LQDLADCVPARIFVKILESGDLVDEELEMDEDIVTRTMRKKVHANFCLFDIYWRALTYNNCFDRVVRNGTRTIILVKATQININRQLLAAMANHIDRAEGSQRRKKLAVRRRLRTAESL